MCVAVFGKKHTHLINQSINVYGRKRGNARERLATRLDSCRLNTLVVLFEKEVREYNATKAMTKISQIEPNNQIVV